MERTLLGAPSVQVRGGSLTVVSGGAKMATVRIGADPCVVGRHHGCDLVLRDPKVSATHIELMATDRGVRLRDLGSTNGTFLGEDDDLVELVEARIRKRVTIRCGDAVLEFRPHRPEAVPLSRRRQFGAVVGEGPIMRALFERLVRLAPSDLSVLVEGETGTGKEILARAIHDGSGRATKPFVVVDCAALAPSLAESLLFGHEKGAFTGAATRQLSPFLEANGGTIFLDELGELPLDVQPKLLRVLAEQRVKPLGARDYLGTDVRIIAATRRDLLSEINRGAFRDDLYFRIAEERVRLPPLRERIEDLVPLLRRLTADSGRPDLFRRIAPESLDQLALYRWPGNVRELRSLVRRAIAYDEGGPVQLEALLDAKEFEARMVAGFANGPDGAGTSPFVGTYDDAKRAYAIRLHEAMGGNVTEMGRRAEVSRVTVRGWLLRYGIGKVAKARTPRVGPASHGPRGLSGRTESEPEAPPSSRGARARRATSA